MTNRILTTGGFDKIYSLPIQDQGSPKASLYLLKDLTPQKIARAKTALEERLQKNEKHHYTYEGKLQNFEEEIKEKPYLMKEGTKLYLLEGRKTQQEGTVSHLVTLSQKTSYLFQNRVAVGGNFSIGDNAKIDNLVLQFPEVSSKKSPHPSSLAELTQQLSEHLASFYKTQITAVYKIRSKGAWKISLPIEGIYTNLAIIGEDERKEKNDSKQTFQDRRAPTYETLFKPKQPIAPQDIFNHEKLKNVSQKKAVIFGVAGVGKTTFCEMVAMHGAELWPEFKIVFLLKLRNLNKENYPGRSTPYEFLASECHFNLATYSALLDDPTFREKTLLLLDGYDELPKEAERGSLANAFQELKERFPHIVVTSRPMPVDIDYVTELEIVGFDETSMNSYIEKFYHLLAQKKEISEEEAARKTHQLQEEIKERSILKSLVQIPINLSLACSLFKEDETFFDSTQKFSLTSFYVEASNWCYKKYQLRPGMSSLSEAAIRQQKNPRMMSEKVDHLAEAIEEIAWGAMKRDTLYLDQDFIEEVLSKKGLSLDDLTHSGLLSVEEGKGQFIHLTFQEYYAASHLVSLLKKPATQARACRFIQEEKYNPRMQIVFWFAAGLCSLDKNDISSSSSSSSGCNHKWW